MFIVSPVASFIKKNVTAKTVVSCALFGSGFASVSAFAAAPTPFSLTAAMVDPIINALSANFSVALAAAFGLMAVTLVGKAAFSIVKGMISRAI